MNHNNFERRVVMFNEKDLKCSDIVINHILYLDPPAQMIMDVKHIFKGPIEVTKKKDNRIVITGIVEKTIKYIDNENNTNEIIEEIAFKDEIKCCEMKSKDIEIKSKDIFELCRKLSGKEIVEGKILYKSLIEKIAISFEYNLL
jgi:DNA replicative helicase MCM subunit Mcm2 (Cdc46/Mcm family)